MSPPTKKSSPVAEHVRASLPKPEKDWPNEPIGGSNPYYRCSACHRSDPEISYKGHYVHCEWAQEQARRREALSMLDELLALHQSKVESLETSVLVLQQSAASTSETLREVTADRDRLLQQVDGLCRNLDEARRERDGVRTELASTRERLATLGRDLLSLAQGATQ